MTVRILFIFCFFLFASGAYAQVERPVTAPRGVLPGQKPGSRPDTLRNKADTLKAKRDSIQRKQKSEIETTITYSALDSINSSVNRKIVHLYGDAKIKYGIIELMAEEITIDYETSTISASGKLDSLGRRVGYPVFINGSEKYETQSIVYNFKTKKAKITEIVTKQNEGIIHGNSVFKNERNELLSIKNTYTTCDLAHPHYGIIATKAKAIPNDKIVVGPFYMQVNDVPLPVGFLFGLFPSPRKSASGIIIPAYGEERNRGFFLRGGGYFFDVSEYFKLTMTGDIYSKGSSAFYIGSQYSNRYHYTGTFNFSYTNNTTDEQIENPSTTKDFRITWNHSPQSKGTGRFSASVNAATATYNTNNFLPTNTNPSIARLDNTSRKLSSNIAYSKTFGSLYSLGLNLRINQDLTTKQVDLPLPDASFNINNVYPFKKTSQSMILQNLSMRYTMSATNQITNNLGRNFTDAEGAPITHDSIAPFNFTNMPTFIRNARKGIRQTIPLATSFKVLNFFTLSPSFNYEELWYFEKLNWAPSADGTTAVVKDTLRSFNRVSNYSMNVGLTTRIYGTYFFKKGGSIKAIRHIINPTIGFSFAPDFGDPSYGYYQKLDLVNSTYPVYKSVHEGFAYGSSTSGKSNSLSFGINNNVEMKVQSKKDTVAKKISIFNTLSINSAYNFALDSFKLAPFAISANTNVLNNKLNVNLTSSLDPYKYVTIVQTEDPGTIKEIRTSDYAWANYQPSTAGWVVTDGVGTSIGRITNANLALSTNLNPKAQKKDTDTRDKIAKSNASDADKNYLLKNPDAYIDFNIPWSLRISYNADYSHSVNSKPRITQTLTTNGDFSLTEKWKIVFNTGYDFQQKDVTLTTFTISRDLHCWTINLTWVPFGKFQSYGFYIGVKSSLLKDLKLNRNRSFYDN